MSPTPADPTPEPVNIFAAPLPPIAEPPIAEPHVAEPSVDARQASLETRHRSSSMMGAPGEAESPAEDPSDGAVTAEDLGRLSGAQSTTDLLAASAAWLTLSESKASFTRREVMTVFDQIPGEHNRSLEARIKGYGKLVRNGQLVLVDDGMFALSRDERDRYAAMLPET
ncbi:MAG: hypothetical protein AAF317_12605 [Pseudomonadota bacterium]